MSHHLLAIGTFAEGKGLKAIDSCSSVTHSDNRYVLIYPHLQLMY